MISLPPGPRSTSKSGYSTPIGDASPSKSQASSVPSSASGLLRKRRKKIKQQASPGSQSSSSTAKAPPFSISPETNVLQRTTVLQRRLAPPESDRLRQGVVLPVSGSFQQRPPSAPSSNSSRSTTPP